MPYATIAEAEARIAELEKENNSTVRETMSHKKGYKQLADFLADKGFDVKGDLEEQWSNSIVGKSKSELETLSKKLDKITAAYERSEQEKVKLSEDAFNNRIKSDLSEKMKDVIGGNDLIELWLSKKKIKSLDNNKVIFDDDGDEISLDKAVEKFKKSNPDRVKVSQNSGSGSSGNSSTSQQTTETKKIKADEFYKMDQKTKASFLKSGGEVLQPEKAF
jgi:hypothetical protein